MAEGTEDGQKTEQPTSRKLDEARRRGQVAQSREVTHWLVMAGSAAGLFIFAPRIAGAMRHSMTRFFAGSATMTVENGLGQALRDSFAETAAALAPALAVMMAAGLAGPLLQNGFIFAPEKLAPKLEHISPAAGAARIFSLRAVMEFLKGLLKMAAVGGVAVWMLMPELSRLAILPGLGAAALGGEIEAQSLRLAAGVVAALTLIAIADLAYQRLSFLRSMRMSKQEVKEEYKQSEGDPFIKGKIRQIRTARARRRMMAAVPAASVVITNPTHFAVALQYEMNTSAAPRLVAKGADLMAARIREVARRHDVPIVENPPVARALYAAVDLDREIPPEHYKAVAEIISYVFRIKGKLKPR